MFGRKSVGHKEANPNLLKSLRMLHIVLVFSQDYTGFVDDISTKK
jgi:hypothetical protein